MIRDYIKAKRAEFKVKATIYGTIAEFIADKTGRLDTIKNLIDSLKGLTGVELRSEFIGALAKIVHEEAQKDRLSE